MIREAVNPRRYNRIRDERKVTAALVRLVSSPIYTTGDVAKICRVSGRVVQQWIDAGRLAGYRIPQTMARRVRRDDLVAFLRKTGMLMEGPAPKGGGLVLYFGLPAGAPLPFAGGPPIVVVDVTSVDSMFQAGQQAARLGVVAIVCDFGTHWLQVAGVAGRLRQLPATQAAAIAAVLGEDQGADGLPDCRFDLIVQRPFDPAVLRKFLAAAIRRKGGAA